MLQQFVDMDMPLDHTVQAFIAKQFPVMTHEQLKALISYWPVSTTHFLPSLMRAIEKLFIRDLLAAKGGDSHACVETFHKALGVLISYQLFPLPGFSVDMPRMIEWVFHALAPLYRIEDVGELLRL